MPYGHLLGRHALQPSPTKIGQETIQESARSCPLTSQGWRQIAPYPLNFPSPGAGSRRWHELAYTGIFREHRPVLGTGLLYSVHSFGGPPYYPRNEGQPQCQFSARTAVRALQLIRKLAG